MLLHDGKLEFTYTLNDTRVTKVFDSVESLLSFGELELIVDPEDIKVAAENLLLGIE
jgi:hypothetical protein